MKTALHALESLVAVVLALIGIAGVAYKAFRDGGWVTTGLGRLADFIVDFPLIALGLTTAMFFSYRAWRSRQALGHSSKFLVDMLLYAFMAAGVYFIAQYVLKGEI